MSGFETSVPALITGLWAVLLALLIRWEQRGCRHVIGTGYALLIAGLQAVAGLFVLLLLLQPVLQRRVPDRNAFRVAILADSSQSMRELDCEGGALSRFQVLQQLLEPDGDHTLVGSFPAGYRLEIYQFSETIRPLHGRLDGLLPGRTALGTALQECLDRRAPAPLGAVVLLSDGHSNSGVSPMEVSRQFRQRDIPVSCVGIGSMTAAGDLRIRFERDTQRAVKGEPCRLTARIVNTLSPQPIRTRVTLDDGLKTVASRDVVVPPGLPGIQVAFRMTPSRAGFQTMAVRLESVSADRKPDTDVDYAALQVSEPDVFRVLFVSAHLGWEYRFLKILGDASEQVRFTTVIRTGPNSFYTAGESASESETGFAAAAADWNRFDVVLFDTRVAPLLSEAAAGHLAGFVADRGGGLLCFGPLGPPQASLSELLPSAWEEPVRGRVPWLLETSPTYIFSHDPGNLLGAARALALAPHDPVWLPTRLKPGARSAASVRGTEQPILVAQTYGSGRVAYLGTENTWRWRLQSAAGADLHDAFWHALLVWLGSSGKQRVTAFDGARKFGLGSPVPLDAKVLGPDYQPAATARVQVELVAPSGQRREFVLDPAAQELGRYTAVVFPDEVGEYRATYAIDLQGERVDHQAHFLVRRSGPETEQTPYREDVLRDIARLTGGVFRRYGEPLGFDSVPVSARVPRRVIRVRWTEKVWLLPLFVTVLAAAWAVRRRIGLR